MIRSAVFLFAASAVGVVSVASPQDRIHFEPGIPSFEGASLAGLGDVDQDGFSDLAVGGGPAGVGARVMSGFSGKELFTLPDFGNNLTTGIPLADAGDLDGDGAHDVALGFALSPDKTVAVFSGRTGALVFAVATPAELVGIPSSFGSAVGSAGDVNGDGLDDLLVGAPGMELAFGGIPFSQSGRVYVRSGADGSPLFHVDSPLPSIGFGVQLDRLGDVDDDGVLDFLVGAVGHAYVVSGNGGTVLSSFASSTDEGFGAALAGCGDLDGDGRPDLVVGGAGAPHEFQDGPGFAIAFSSATRAELWRVDGAPGASLGKSVRRLPDANGDGVDDVVVGAPGPFFPPTSAGQVLGLSGSDGATLFTVEAGPADFRFGFFVEGLDDVNGDGAPDFALTSQPPALEARLDVFSTRDLALVTDGDSVSLAAGGTQTLRIQAGAAAAGRQYFVLGSASGVKPGVVYDGQAIPLNLDAYLLFTLTHPLNGLIAGALGSLDAEGAAQATLTAPPALPVLVGQVVEHAAIVWEGPVGGAILAVTNAATLRFEP